MIVRRWILGCLIALCGMLGMLLFSKASDYTDITFSHTSGFYDKPFELELYSPIGTKIYYTLDGSTPDETSLLYTEPILIEDATSHDNLYCMRTDMSTSSYSVPDYPIDKCTVVRAAYLDADGIFGETKTESYFVGYDNKTGYEGMHIISLSTDPDSLFDPYTGIYILGANYNENYLLESSSYDLNQNTNFLRKGVDWERPGSVQLFSTSRLPVLSQSCGIRIQGCSSRFALPKSLNLYARERYGQDGRFYTDIFSTDYMADAITLFTGSGDSTSKLRDMLMSKLTADRNFARMNYMPYVMFLNGEYWGVYWMTEKYDDAYLAHYYETETNNVVMIKGRELTEGKESDYKLYEEMMDYLTGNDLTNPEVYHHVCDIIDIQSYIDYYAAQIYISRQDDWPGWNEALWRTRTPDSGQYEDCKWRWMLFDSNSMGLSTDVLDTDTLDMTMSKNLPLYNLCQNDTFRQQFTITTMDLANTSFAEENVDKMISGYIDFMSEPMQAHLKRFYNSKDPKPFLDAVADIQNFFAHRRPYVIQYLKDNFQLDGAPAPVEIEINDGAAGNIVINTTTLTFNEETHWCGEYFTDYPIALTAVANEGYHFVGWEGDETSESEYVELRFDDAGVHIKAVFEKNTIS